MKNVKLALLVFAAAGVACATASAQQPRIFDWRPANDELVRMDPGNYYTAQTYHPGPQGGNIHLDIKSERPVTVFMTDAMGWELALQHPETIRDVRTSCTQEHVTQVTYACNLPGVAMTLVIRDERRSREGEAFAEFGAVIRPEESTNAAVATGMEAARIGERFAHRFSEPNDLHIQYYRWDCVQNCVQPEFRWIEQVKEKYDLTSFLKVYGGFIPDHDQTQVDIKIKAPVPMIVAMLPSSAANELHARPEVLESALEKSPCQQRGVQKMEFQCTFNAADGPQSLIVAPEDAGKVPHKKTEIEMQVVKCVDNCQLIETGQKSAAANDTPKQN